MTDEDINPHRAAEPAAAGLRHGAGASPSEPGRHGEDPKYLSPDELVAGYSRSPIAKCVLFAIAFHVVVIGATSVGTILRWAGLSGPGAAKPSALAGVENTPAPTTQPAGPTTRPAAGAAAPRDWRKDTKVYKDITETRPAPKDPDDDPRSKIPYDITNR